MQCYNYVKLILHIIIQHILGRFIYVSSIEGRVINQYKQGAHI